MLHRFEIHGGDNARVIYTSRHTATGVESRILRNDSTLVFFGSDPCKTIFGRIQSIYHQLSDIGQGVVEQRMKTDAEGENINVTISPNFPLGDELEREWNVNAGMALVVKTDANMLQLIDHQTLKPKKIFTYNTIDKENNGRFAAAHHQYDEETGEWINFTLEVFPKPMWRVFSYASSKASGSIEVKKFQPITENLSLPKNLIFPNKILKVSYTHSFSITKKYIVIPNWSYYFSYNSLAILWYGNAYESLYFDRNLPTLFHVLNRQTGLHVATYEADPAFAFHTANAWEEDETIWMDIATYPDSRIIDDSFDFARMYDEDDVKPATYRSDQNKASSKDVAVAEIRRYKLSDVPSAPSNMPRRADYTLLGLDLDLPRFDPRRQQKSYRYLYGTCRNQHTCTYKGSSRVILNGIQKMDLGIPPTLKVSCSDEPFANDPSDKIHGSGPHTCRFDPPSASCSEPIFLPNPNGTDEDDGVVLTMVNEIGDNGEETCALVVLNSKDMTLIARAEIGPWHTKTVHGSFVDHCGKGISVS
jgi:torulene dioxygenase